MATAKKKTKKKVEDPFTVSSGSTKKKTSSLPDVKVPKTLIADIDDFCQLDKEMKSKKAEMETCKNSIADFARTAFAQRLVSGKSGTIVLSGTSGSVQFQTKATGKTIGSDEVEELKDKWGSDVIDECLKRDVTTMKLDPEVYEQHQDEINKTLAALQKKIGASLFTSMFYKVPKNIMDVVGSHADNAEELEELISDLKITTSVGAKK